MEDYVVAIPSYQRHNIIESKTLRMLARCNVSSNTIYIFVANETEKKMYEEFLDKTKYNKIVVGIKGITKQRIFISKYFPNNKYIISIDDDVEKIFKLKQNKLVEIKNLHKFFISAYKKLLEEKLFIWGVYPTPNKFFMYNKITKDLRFIIGSFYGYINRHDNRLYPSNKIYVKEDYHKTILFYLKDCGVVRYNNIAFKSKPYAEGGLGKNRFNINEKATNYLVKKYPSFLTKKRRKNGLAELKLNKTVKCR